jgi:hypothetical protein
MKKIQLMSLFVLGCLICNNSLASTCLDRYDVLDKEPCSDTIYLVNGGQRIVEFLGETARYIVYNVCSDSISGESQIGKKEIDHIIFSDGQLQNFRGHKRQKIKKPLSLAQRIMIFIAVLLGSAALIFGGILLLYYLTY